MHLISLEQVGYDESRYGVAEITGFDGGGGLIRRPLRPQRDYSQANSVGSRGIMAHYVVSDSKVYEVKAPVSWKKIDHYYVTFGQGQEWRMSIGQIIQWLQSIR